MFHVRREIQRWALPPPRQENLLTGLGQAIWRAIRLGLVRTAAQSGLRRASEDRSPETFVKEAA